MEAENKTNQDILETQIDNLFASIMKRLQVINAELERVPSVVQENLEKQRQYDFFENLLKDTGEMK